MVACELKVLGLALLPPTEEGPSPKTFGLQAAV